MAQGFLHCCATQARASLHSSSTLHSGGGVVSSTVMRAKALEFAHIDICFYEGFEYEQKAGILHFFNREVYLYTQIYTYWK